MKNLAGCKDADDSIKEELYIAGIEMINVGGTVCSEVPYSVIGRVGYWTLTRAWYYWVADVERLQDGLPMETALELHNKPHPTMTRLGNVIRSGGHCGCPSPDEFGASSFKGRYYVDCYHIDDQIGLNEFAKAVKELMKKSINEQ
jgi:hypothetical protein